MHIIPVSEVEIVREQRRRQKFEDKVKKAIEYIMPQVVDRGKYRILLDNGDFLYLINLDQQDVLDEVCRRFREEGYKVEIMKIKRNSCSGSGSIAI
jgi:hypothetical protein